MRPTVYPRACGGTSLHSGSHPRRKGLSPRVRGNRAEHLQTPVNVGSIPARAGEPQSLTPRPLAFSVYPRACGGTDLDMVLQSGQLGLSPRVRGNLPEHVGNIQVGGSIPARAGEPSRAEMPVKDHEVYPRACGGTIGGRAGRGIGGGLSPRVRGNRVGQTPRGGRQRSIPARAGEPPTPGSSGAIPTVYPRACGGTPPRSGQRRVHAGLSPRVRGNHAQRVGEQPGLGSIPARAGEPAVLRASRVVAVVYPRACGGTKWGKFLSHRGSGLSPRVRGNPSENEGLNQDQGSIPARAGEPGWSCSKSHAQKVYPRACGGTG